MRSWRVRELNRHVCDSESKTPASHRDHSAGAVTFTLNPRIIAPVTTDIDNIQIHLRESAKYNTSSPVPFEADTCNFRLPFAFLDKETDTYTLCFAPTHCQHLAEIKHSTL